MPDPIAWQIQEDIESSLRSINGSGSYFYNFCVKYKEFDQNEFNALTAIVSSGTISRNDERLHQSKTDWDHVFFVHVSVPPGDTTVGEKDQRLMRAFADVARAVMADPRRSDLAHDTFVLGYEPIDAGSKRLTCLVQVQVTYRTDEQDLTSK